MVYFGRMKHDIEKLRNWYRDRPWGDLKRISRQLRYPYRSLENFVRGVTKEPRYSHIEKLVAYRDKHKARR